MRHPLYFADARCGFALILKQMNRWCCFLLFLCLGMAAAAQQNYYAYLQTDDNAPFYVKLNDQVISSAESGYLILPGLVDSTYRFSIGFPGTQVESRFQLAVDGRDHGLLIRRADRSLSLSDLQSGQTIAPQVDELDKNITYRPREDSFTRMLSTAANDPTLLYVQVVAKQEPPKQEVKQDVAVQPPPKKEDTVAAAVIQKDTAAVVMHPADTASTVVQLPPHADTTVQQTVSIPAIDTAEKHTETVVEKKPEPPVVQQEPGQPYRPSKVTKHAESSTSEGFGLVYYDVYEGGADTIRLLIPNPRIQLRQPDTAPQDTGMLDIKKEAAQAAPVKIAPSAVCPSVATDNDFYKLRKNMAAKTSDEAMVGEAKKYFKGKCFSTEQVRNLSSLFLTSAGKYQFFDAAYLHVTDQDQFRSLGSEIHDDYYQKRFKALISE